MDTETQSRSLLVSPITLDLNIETIREAFEEIGEVEDARYDDKQQYGIITFKNKQDALEALKRNGASIMGQTITICLMSRADPASIRLNNRIQGAELDTTEYDKRAFTILSCPEEERKERLQSQLLLLTPQQKDAFLETYRKCENIFLTRQRFDKAVADADDPNYKEPHIGSDSSDSGSESSRSRSRSRSYSRHHYRHHSHHHDRYRHH